MTTGAAYAKAKWESRRWILSGGLRYTLVRTSATFGRQLRTYPFLPEAFTATQQNVAGALGASYAVNPAVQLTANVSRSFRAPNIDDVSKIFDSAPGNVIIPNPDLQPEIANNASAGLRWHGEVITFEGYGYGTLLSDAIVRRDADIKGQDSIVYDGQRSNVQANQNAARARVLGFSASLRARVLSGGPHRLDLSSRLSQSWGRDLTAGVPLDHIPPMFGRSELRYRYKRFTTTLWTDYHGWKRIEDYSPGGSGKPQYATPEGMPAWWTLSLSVRARLSRVVHLTAGCENLLDQHYRTFSSAISGPGRNVFLQAEMNF
jgi:hemoglobin/transferrin/lactoferrin receptor protein